MTLCLTACIMDPMAPTPTAQLADILLGDDGPLEQFVRNKRAERRSWRLISRDLYEATDHHVDVTHETLRSWYPDDVELAR